MEKKSSFTLGKPFGIKVSVHWTFSLLIAYVIFISVSRGLTIVPVLMHVAFILALFLCVVLHELGHSLVAMKFGGKVNSITLLPIGGMANMSEMPEKPREEFLVSAAGPLVNIVIAATIWLYLSFFGGIDIEELEYEYITADNFIIVLFAANLFIVAFNLIPAFPMDGGRLFRSALSIWMNRLKATRIAKNIGQIFAVIFILAGLFYNPFLILIGFFVFLGARGEYEMVKYGDILNNYTVKDLVITKYTGLDENDTLNQAAEKLAHRQDSGFVIRSNGEYKGLLTKNDLINGLNHLGREGKIKDAMEGDAETIAPDMTLFDAYKAMQKNKWDMIAVMDDGKFKGILSLENIHEFFLIKKAMR
ncbi:MAG: site-2 protease family protein [Bacteroidales bacterium]